MNNELYKCFFKHGYNCKNIKPQEEFKLECNRFSLIAKKHLLDCQKTYSALISNIKRKEYSTGGELLPRGFYCPCYRKLQKRKAFKKGNFKKQTYI